MELPTVCWLRTEASRQGTRCSNSAETSHNSNNSNSRLVQPPLLLPLPRQPLKPSKPQLLQQTQAQHQHKQHQQQQAAASAFAASLCSRCLVIKTRCVPAQPSSLCLPAAPLLFARAMAKPNANTAAQAAEAAEQGVRCPRLLALVLVVVLVDDRTACHRNRVMCSLPQPTAAAECNYGTSLLPILLALALVSILGVLINNLKGNMGKGRRSWCRRCR